MCAESLWWHCHRRAGDFATAVRGWDVIDRTTAWWRSGPPLPCTADALMKLCSPTTAGSPAPL